MSLENITPLSLLKAQHIKAFDDTWSHRLSLLPLEGIVVNLIDTTPESVLIWLADQFDVLGLKGWQLVSTQQDKIKLIKSAAALHRSKGTIKGLKDAIISLGFSGLSIIEGINSGNELLCNGVALCNGEFDCGGGNLWATFSVVFDLGNNKGITTANTTNLRAIIKEYKNARSHLININFVANLTEEDEGSETYVAQLATSTTDDFTDNKGLLCNGFYKCNGFRLCGSNCEALKITIYG